MTTIHQRLRAGERIWATEACFRLAGLAALAVAGWIFRQIPPRSQASPREFLAAALAVACLWAGLALALEGPGLLRLMPRPPRALF